MSANNALPPSRRGQQDAQPALTVDFKERLEGDQYHPKKNPKGIIDLGSDTNELMLDSIAGWTRWNLKKCELKDGLGYNTVQESSELLNAAANFMTEHFEARIPLTADNILAGNGATALLDTLTYNIADEGDSILCPTPSYDMSARDISTRNGVRFVTVSCEDIPGERFTGLPRQEHEATSQPELVTRLEKAIERESNQGHKVAGILLANPEGALGRCYEAHILLKVSQLCARHKIHLVVDETYSMSSGDSYISILSLGLDMNISNVHVLWGISKDFGLGGLNIAVLATYNRQLYNAMRTSNRFSCVSSLSAMITTKLLSDKKYMRDHYKPTLNRRLKKRRQLVEGELKRYDIPYLEADSGFFMFLNLSYWLDPLFAQHGKDGDLGLLEYMMDNSVFLELGKVNDTNCLPFGHYYEAKHVLIHNVTQTFSSNRPGWFRLNFGGEKHTVKTGLQRLFRCLNALEDKQDPLAVEDITSYYPPPRYQALMIRS
ncbi:1-aminocyclopropane-1-carboxylate synthase-like protein [Colletotrichum truncatum]|uniref:1-aminocyclopropane-1-carboxylate synthase-like protein n=1 Tax=Colletotrichum truncatum TaxID=5467 RepID=A0ACC3YQA5_COLTU